VFAAETAEGKMSRNKTEIARANGTMMADMRGPHAKQGRCVRVKSLDWCIAAIHDIILDSAFIALLLSRYSNRPVHVSRPRSLLVAILRVAPICRHDCPWLVGRGTGSRRPHRRANQSRRMYGKF
jgi:hypothetical protein